ncbi:MAG: hypothetical protein Kow0069_04260 [Promethearchaeota archaeon]
MAAAAAFAAGVYFLSTFFFSLVGLVVGLLGWLFAGSRRWKRLGATLAYAAGFSTLVVESSPEGLVKGAGPFLGILACLVAAIAELVSFLRWRAGKQWGFAASLRAKYHGLVGRLEAALARGGRRVPRAAARLALLGAPVAAWMFASVDFGVVFDNSPRALWVHAPSSVAPGEEFTVTVEAWDAFERVSATYGGSVNFSLYSLSTSSLAPFDANCTLPANYTFTARPFGHPAAYALDDPRDCGLHEFTARVHDPGVHYVLVRDSFTRRTYWSNPVLVDPAFASGAPRTYWGDLHAHTLLSDGSGDPTHSYLYARRVARLDFCSVTDHGQHLNAFGLTAWPFELLEDATNAANEPGRFVAFQGVEWTSGYGLAMGRSQGHYAVVFDGNELPVISAAVQRTPGQLWAALARHQSATGFRSVAIPHHAVRALFLQDWSYYDPRFVRLAEVFSVHGECLFDPYSPLSLYGSVDAPPVPVNGACLVDAFKMGVRASLCADTDNHDGHPGHSLSHTRAHVGHQPPLSTFHARNGHPHPGGLTAVRAAGLTRAAVFSELHAGRTFASTDFSRPLLDFRVEGFGPGEVWTVNSTAERVVTLFLAADGSPAPGERRSATESLPDGPNPQWGGLVEVFKNGLPWRTQRVEGAVANLTFVDDGPVAGTSYEGCVPDGNGGWLLNRYSDNPLTDEERAALNTAGADFYLVRVSWDSGRAAYAGPVWVAATGA